MLKKYLILFFRACVLVVLKLFVYVKNDLGIEEFS